MKGNGMCGGTSDENAKVHGAVYVTDDGSGYYGFSFQWNNDASAMAEANAQCRKTSGGRPCRKLINAVNQCAAVVFARQGDRILGIAGSAEATQEEADRKAVRECEINNPGADCKIEKRFCSY